MCCRYPELLINTKSPNSICDDIWGFCFNTSHIIGVTNGNGIVTHDSQMAWILPWTICVNANLNSRMLFFVYPETSRWVYSMSNVPNCQAGISVYNQIWPWNDNIVTCSIYIIQPPVSIYFGFFWYIYRLINVFIVPFKPHQFCLPLGSCNVEIQIWQHEICSLISNNFCQLP